MLTVDIHAHVFNADDLPVKGFLDKQGVPAVIAALIDAVIQAATQSGNKALLADGLDDLSDLTDVAEELLAAALADNLDLAEALARLRDREISDKGLIDTLSGLRDVPSAVRWAVILTRPRMEIATLLFDAYPDVDLFVPMMMDMDLWVADEPKVPLAERILQNEDLAAMTGGRLLPFVPFDPRRAVERPEDAPLDLVKDAVLNRGFAGVKVYPPMGFRPSNNAQAVPALTDPAAYDRVLGGLFKFCADEEVPITAHCTPEGAEAAPGERSGLNANPAYWRDMLKAHPGLRLNLAHFGGVENALENTDAPDKVWARTITGLMADFDHVYADTGHHGINRWNDRRRYFNVLEDLVRDAPVLKARYMFGSDWHMIARTHNHTRLLRTYREKWGRLPGVTEADVAGLTGGNALAFLGLVPGGKTLTRLRKYYDGDGRARPAWMARL